MTSTAASSRTRSSAVGSAPAGCARPPRAASRCAMSFMTFAMRDSASVLTSANCAPRPDFVEIQAILAGSAGRINLAYRAPRRCSGGLWCRACNTAAQNLSGGALTAGKAQVRYRRQTRCRRHHRHTIGACTLQAMRAQSAPVPHSRATSEKWLPVEVLHKSITALTLPASAEYGPAACGTRTRGSGYPAATHGEPLPPTLRWGHRTAHCSVCQQPPVQARSQLRCCQV